MGAGAISGDHAVLITRTTDQLPTDVRQLAEQRLVGAARRMHPGQLAKEAVRVLNDLHPDGPARLERAEQEAKARRELSIAPDRAGRGFHLAGRLDVEGAAADQVRVHHRVEVRQEVHVVHVTVRVVVHPAGGDRLAVRVVVEVVRLDAALRMAPR